MYIDPGIITVTPTNGLTVIDYVSMISDFVDGYVGYKFAVEYGDTTVRDISIFSVGDRVLLNEFIRSYEALEIEGETYTGRVILEPTTPFNRIYLPEWKYNIEYETVIKDAAIGRFIYDHNNPANGTIPADAKIAMVNMVTNAIKRDNGGVKSGIKTQETIGDYSATYTSMSGESVDSLTMLKRYRVIPIA